MIERKKNITKSKNETTKSLPQQLDFNNDLLGVPYMPEKVSFTTTVGLRELNPVVYLEFTCIMKTKSISLGKLYIELRKDLVPIAATNFLALVTGQRGFGDDGVNYHYKGILVHRIVKDVLFQSGDLLDTCGDTSRSIFNNGGLFKDENFLFRHVGPGCISYCNRGPDTNGSLFQVTFRPNEDLDGKYVVFGCLGSNESYECLNKINSYGTDHGATKEEIRISDCGVAYQPDSS